MNKIALLQKKITGRSFGNFTSPAWKLNRSLGISRGVFVFWLATLAWFLLLPPPAESLWLGFLVLFLLFAYLALTALGIGRILTRLFNLPLPGLEFNLVASLLGLGLLSMLLMVIGLVGLLNRPVIFVSLAVSGFMASAEWNGIIRSLVSKIRAVRLTRNASIYETVLLILITGLFPVLIVNTLTPAWDYDALLYHLEIPRQFLSQGRIYFDPEVMRSAYPFLGEMLFLVGMIFRLDSLAKLINLTYAILFVISTYAFANRFFNREVALMAIGILVSTPILLLWTTWVSVDFAWSVYELWAVYAIWLWQEQDKTDTGKWMALAGIMSGLAASIKYISLPAFLILVILISWKSMQTSKYPFSETFRNLLIFGSVAGMVMGVWYIKNWIWTGNPVYPLLFGGVGWDPIKDQIFNTDYMKSFGLERNLLNFILLPYYVYTQHNRFSTFPLEIIHPLIWLAFLFPFLEKSKKYLDIVLYSFAYYAWWFLGSQVIRFLLPVSAFLAILAGSVLNQFHPLLKNIMKLLVIVGLLIFSLVYQITVLRNSGAFSYISSQTSSQEILAGFVDDYRVKQFIQQSLAGNERALFLWDGRGYYCDSRCIPDNSQTLAVKLALKSPKPEGLARELKSAGFTHIMLSLTDANWFIQYHDPNQTHRQCLQYFKEQFLPECGKSVYKDAGMELFEITCD